MPQAIFHAALFIFSTLMVQVFISVTSDIGLDNLIFDFLDQYKKKEIDEQTWASLSLPNHTFPRQTYPNTVVHSFARN